LSAAHAAKTLITITGVETVIMALSAICNELIQVDRMTAVN